MGGEAFVLVGKTVLPGGLLRRAAVVVEGGGISEVIEGPRRGDLPPGSREVFGLVCPGFVELQINGGKGDPWEGVFLISKGNVPDRGETTKSLPATRRRT